MSLKRDILAWDGKSTSDIKEIYRNHSQEDDVPAHWIRLMKHPKLQAGASWMLKQHCEINGEFSKKLSLSVYRQIDHLADWQSRLHLLQMMPYLTIDQSTKHLVENFLRCQLTDPNKFVRAWAYNGFHLLAQSFPEYQKEVDHFFELAMKDEAASVKARIRQITR